MTSPGPTRSLWPFIALAGLVAAVGLTFAPVLGGGFVGLDDGNNIFLNPQMGGLSWERIAWAFRDLGSARRYMPLGWLGFSTVFSWQGLAPAGYHAVSLAWHLLAAALLFAVARNILRAGMPAATAGWNILVSLLVAAAWALHPMRTEAVAWASGLLYTQASAFAFVAVWLWTLRWASPEKAGWFSAGSCVALAASLLTYPIALGLPAVCRLLDWVVENKAAVGAPRPFVARYRVTGGLLGLVLVAGAVLAATLAARSENSASFAAPASPFGDFYFSRVTLRAFYVWGRYLIKLVWPANLSPVYTELYSFHPLDRGVLATALLSALGFGAVGWIAWRRRAQLPLVVLAYSAMALPFLGLLEHPWIAHDRAHDAAASTVWLIAGAWWLLQLKSGAGPPCCFRRSAAPGYCWAAMQPAP